MHIHDIARKSVIASLCAAVCGGAAASDFDELMVISASGNLENYEKTEETVNCLPLSMVKDSDPVDDYMILFEVSGGDVFLNELDGRCAGLERERRFSYRTTQNKICQGDIITVTDTFGTVRGSCSLGSFQKLSKM